MVRYRKDGCVCDSNSKINGAKTTQYIHWNNMLKRALNKKYKENKPTYQNVTVCDTWKIFSNFEKWFNSQVYKDGYELDKDIININSKEYSPNNCCLVPRYINSVINNKKANNSSKFIGVNLEKNGKYKASCREAFTNKQVTLGRFDNPHDAYATYKVYKETQIKIVAEHAYTIGDIDQRVYNALLEYSI